jgi:hypothetical protein
MDGLLEYLALGGTLEEKGNRVRLGNSSCTLVACRDCPFEKTRCPYNLEFSLAEVEGWDLDVLGALYFALEIKHE